MAKNEAKQIKIKLVRSLIGTTPNQRKVVAGLGLSKKDQVVEHFSTPTIMGMVNKVSHLLQIVE
ncbi:MAG: 50S ribosomal protein L30 [Clostridiaceae bacterium]|jgi:large subunit ribosomal protein L30|nr:50S ribosomal protein L30 [Clostridiaceae bacterium]